MLYGHVLVLVAGGILDHSLAHTPLGYRAAHGRGCMPPFVPAHAHSTHLGSLEPHARARGHRSTRDLKSRAGRRSSASPDDHGALYNASMRASSVRKCVRLLSAAYVRRELGALGHYDHPKCAQVATTPTSPRASRGSVAREPRRLTRMRERVRGERRVKRFLQERRRLADEVMHRGRREAE